MNNQPVDHEWFKEYLESKFSHFETENKHIEDKLDKILIQTTITNGRVGKLEEWRATAQGTWSGLNKVAIVGATGLGVIMNIVWDWYKSKP